ncbi:MAG: glycosyltransferase family 39 protein [Acidobacteria bacterium]|nr:glycosyltransferase family 39 protein [Acidobacteriota bacterium]
MSSRRAIQVTMALTAAALALRLYRLDDGMWLDEISTWIRFMGLRLTEIPSTYGSENQHFLFSLLARISMNVFGEHVWSFRLPAVLFGVASIWAMYLFGAEAAGRKEGVLSAALLTFSYHHIWFSQNARGYSGLLFWTLLTSWLLLKAFREGRTAVWLWYACAAGLGVYTHATMSFVLLSHTGIAAWLAWQNRMWRGPALGFGMGAGLTVLLHAPALPAIFTGLKNTVSVVEEWKSPLWTLLELLQGVKIGFTGAAVAVAALALFLAGLWSFWRERPVVLTLLAAPPLIGSVILLSMGHHIWPRFYYFAFGFGALIVIRGALLVPRAGMAMAIGIIAVSAASAPFAYGPKQDFGSAYELVRSSRQPGDVVATADLATWVFERYYKAGWVDVRSMADLDRVSAGAPRTWLVYTIDPVFRSQLPELYASVRREFRVVKVFPGTLRSGEVTVCLREGSR